MLNLNVKTQVTIYNFKRIESINQDCLIDAFEVIDNEIEKDYQDINRYFDSLF
jgi:hypothetical protein